VWVVHGSGKEVILVYWCMRLIALGKLWNRIALTQRVKVASSSSPVLIGSKYRLGRKIRHDSHDETYFGKCGAPPGGIGVLDKIWR